MNYQPILEKVQHYAQHHFETHTNDNLVYHNQEHTKNVVAAAAQIANHYQLSDHDFFVVLTAAWFHDLGYYTSPAAHEEEGARLAGAFLQENNIDEATIQAVKQCIIATKLPQNPTNLLEQIVCDADLFHLGTDDFFPRNKLMRKEVEAVKHLKINKGDWRTGNVHFLQSHHYHTDYARLLLDAKKEENLHQLEKDKEKGKGDPVVALVRKHTAEEEQKEEKENGEVAVKEKKEKKAKNNRPDRGIETVFKITSGNNQRLSSQADSKAHIMIQVNSIIISVLLSLLLRRIEEHASLAIPTFMLLTVNVLTIIFSVLATRPNIPPGTFTPLDVDEKKVNLLFFGNFYKMSLEDYASGMLKMMDDSEFLYGSLIKDVYFQGIALGRKYKLLRLSYNIFMFGLIASVIAFIIAVSLFGK
ncbi:metal-dependent phosphohydrolase HD sub domain-containing protein [Russula earlei]|uniref:Metal-dependent phosphohydrolase HD sub domain-containing protein n=1 Tax=Russula earlei TaxID=71964 RepID=A0ACC0TT84_9AGAM|nr:metal-dependent phosphohydrolase HD sub domain-containing protein [Russula earlei]